MQADFQAWYKPLIATAEEASETPSRQAAAPPKPFPRAGVQDDSSPRVHTHHTTQFSYEDRKGHAPMSTRERRDGTAPPDGGEGRGDNTPTRRPRLPVDAWGTPPGSVNREGTSKAEGSISVGSGSSGGAPAGPGGANGSSSYSGVGVGGLFPPLTGEDRRELFSHLCSRYFLRNPKVASTEVRGKVVDGGDAPAVACVCAIF